MNATISSSTTTASTAIKSTTASTTLTTTERPITPKMSIDYENMNEIINNLNDIKMWLIIISIIIIKLVLIKVMRLCKKTYAKHNENVIKKHNRISPIITSERM